jgi:uncharacterized protein (DUF1778 family)
MTKKRSAKQPKAGPVPSPLMVRLDSESKALLRQAAAHRRISVSDYVRTVVVAQARNEVQALRHQLHVLTPAEELAFWNALNAVPTLTPSQRRLGAVMRGQA